MKSETFFHSTLDHLLEGCQIIDFEWKYLFINRAAEIHNKRPNSELLGRHYREMWPGIETTEVYRQIAETLEKKIPNRLENQFTYPNGSVGWFDLSIQPIPEGVLILSIDISDRKIAEEQLKTSEEKYRLLSDSSEDWIYWVTPNGNYKYISPSVERLTGYSAAEFESDPGLLFKLVHPNDKELVRAHHKLAHDNFAPGRVEFRIITRDGQTIWLIHTCNPIFSDNGTYLGQRANNRNITERKLNDELLIESESRFRKIFEEGPFGMVMANKDFLFIKANPLFCKIIGYTEAELRKLSFKDVSHPDDVKNDLINVQKLINKEISVYKTEKRYIRKDGKIIWASLSVTSNYDNEGNFLYNLGTIEDITHRKRVEEALKKSKELLSETESMGKVGGWEFNIDTMEQTWTEEVYRIHEVDLGFKQDVDKGINFYAPASRPIIEKAVQRVIEFGEPFDLELEIITAKGNLRSVHSIGKADLEHRRVYGFFQDITERKLAEEKLRENQLLLKHVLDCEPDAIFAVDIDYRLLINNKRHQQVLVETGGHRLQVGESILPSDYPKEALDFWRQLYNQVFSGEEFKRELEWTYSDGLLHTTENYFSPLRDASEEIIGALVVIHDITERKHAENEIKRLNERITTATRASAMGIWDWDIKNNKLVWDEQMYNLYGIRKEEFPGAYEAWLNGLHPEDKEKSDEITKKVLQEHRDYDTEFRVLWPNGSVRWLRASGQVFYDDNQHPVRMIGVNLDVTERKLAEESLRNNEALLNEVGRLAQVGGWEFSPLTGDASWTEEVARIHDLDPKTPASVALSINFYSEKSRPIIEKAFNDAITLARPYDLELEIISAKGIRKWIRTIGHPVVQNGKVVKIRGSFQDITEMRVTTKALHESEEKFRLAFATNPDAITIARLSDSVFVSANNGFTQIFGYSEKEVLDKTSLEIDFWCNPEDRKLFVNELKSNGIVENFETRFYTKERQIKDVLVSSISLDFKGATHILSTIKDITERKHAEEALRESEEKFRNLIESLPLPVTYVNNRGEIVFRNDRFLQVMGYTQEEVPTVNEWWGKAYPDEKYQKQVVRQWGSAVEHAKLTDSDIDPIEYNITCKDGIQRTMIVSGIIIDDNLLITFIDITDRKKAEEEIRKLNETLEERVDERTKQLQEANQELEAFSYSVSHDLRAPLRHINGFVDLLTENYADILPEKGKHYLEVIVNSSRHMGTLIDDLLQFSRTSRQEMQKTEMNMSLILYDALNSLKTNIESRKIEWNIAELPKVKGDQSLLRMVWVNLLSNAVKFTKAKNPAKIQIGYTDDSKEFTFFVRDNGAGFDMRFAHKLFGVFQRLHTTKEFEGTGIGLANVRRIILKHGGRTWAESQINEGATFYFTLPKPKS